MLNNAFLVHDGWKFPKQFYAKKDVDSAQNRLLFQYHFKDELPRKYNTNRTCSPVEPYMTYPIVENSDFLKNVVFWVNMF